MIAKYKTRDSQQYQDILKGRKKFILTLGEKFVENTFVLIQEYNGEQYTGEMCFRVVSHVEKGFGGSVYCSLRLPKLNEQIEDTMTCLQMIDCLLVVREFDQEITDIHYEIGLCYPKSRELWRLDRTAKNPIWFKQ